MSDPHIAPLAEVGRYRRLADARERSLVVAARQLPYWIERQKQDWVLLVEPAHEALIVQELAAFEAEEKARPAPRPVAPLRIPWVPLFVAGWVITLFFGIQSHFGEAWLERGVARSDAILQKGEWWRTITALTLHADFGHFAGNLLFGLLFAAFVLPQLGGGATWLFILLSGILGNALNAWGYRGDVHGSIGASTAVFGALGLLVGADLIGRLMAHQIRRLWQIVVPLGAGLAFLAFLGVGEEGGKVDIMAHFWGLSAGMPLGMLAAGLRIHERWPAWAQRSAGMAALLLPVVAWWLAWLS